MVAYFSATNTTRPLAEYAADILSAGLYEIVPEDPYTDADLAYYTNGRADREQNDASARPAISGSVENMEQYDIVFLGYPIWNGQAPKIISTFLESHDLSGKTIVPFCTSHSSGIGSSAANLHTLATDANWLNGSRFAEGTDCSTVETWVNGLNLSDSVKQEPQGPADEEHEEDAVMPQIKIEAGGQTFTATLLDNPTTRALLERLPMTVSMGELNGNEKYYYLPESLPTNSQRPGNIRAGDLMLYGSDGLVLFYESFSSGYSYTRLGNIDDLSNLVVALGRGNVDVTFKAN